MRVFTFVAHSVVYGMIEIETIDSYTRYRLSRNIDELGVVEFPSHISPKISVATDGHMAFYGGCNVYVPKETELCFFEEEEEVSHIWFVEGGLFLECDTLLVSRKLSDFSVSEQYWHTEIITAGLFCESGLFAFQDLENGVFELNLNSFAVCPSDYPFAKLA